MLSAYMPKRWEPRSERVFNADPAFDIPDLIAGNALTSPPKASMAQPILKSIAADWDVQGTVDDKSCRSAVIVNGIRDHLAWPNNLLRAAAAPTQLAIVDFSFR
jgi:hypothetical protein